MKPFLMLMVLWMGAAVAARAQSAVDLNEGLQLVKDGGTGIFTLSWWGKSGRTYFIQTSPDMLTWSYLPFVETGAADVSGIQFTNTGERQFWRLRYTDQTYTGTAADADFDGDGASNLAEATAGTDPFNPDTDGDDVLDGDELALESDPKVNDWTPRPVEFAYDDTNRLTGHSAPGQTAAVFAPDSEGNVKTSP
jgi:hypothetical protein